MLVLKRRANEQILLTLPNGETIAIKVLWHTRSNVSIGVNAPKTTRIVRVDAEGEVEGGRDE
jgi:carbon storage regulator CsrA